MQSSSDDQQAAMRSQPGDVPKLLWIDTDLEEPDPETQNVAIHQELTASRRNVTPKG